MWRNQELCALLEGIKNGVVAMGNSMTISQKSKHKITVCSSNFTIGYIRKEKKAGTQTDTGTPVFLGHYSKWSKARNNLNVRE